MRKSLLLLGFLVFSFPLIAQLPSSNIFVFNIQKDAEKDSLYIDQPKYLTQYNNNGYNNHPHFLSEEELLLSASTPFESQPNLYSLNTSSLVRTKITDTPMGEYSPRRMPDYFNFSAVRMEFVPGDTLLRLWQFPLDRSSNGRPVFRDITNIGYYAWLNSRDIVLFKVQSPNQLVKSDIYSGAEEVIAQNVGRCFIPAGSGSLLYVQNMDDGSADIMLYDTRAYFDDQKRRKVVTALQGAQDFAVMLDGTIIMAYDSELYKFQLGVDEEWQKFADLRAYNIQGISRIALSPNNGKIALVAR